MSADVLVFPCHETAGQRNVCELDRGHQGRHLSGQSEAGREAKWRRVREGIPIPEDPAKVQGPEVGALVLYHDKYKGTTETVRVKARSYVWSPEIQRPDGYYGYRRYDWTVIERKRGSLVVNDTDLTSLMEEGPDGLAYRDGQPVYVGPCLHCGAPTIEGVRAGHDEGCAVG